MGDNAGCRDGRPEMFMSRRTVDQLLKALALTLALVAPLMHTGSFEVRNVTVRIPDLVALAH